MISKIGEWIGWYRRTATLIGIPVLAWVIVQAVMGCASEVTCKMFDRACRYSFTRSYSTMTHEEAVETLAEETKRCPNGDCVAKSANR